MKGISKAFGITFLIIASAMATIGMRAWSRYNEKPQVILKNDSDIALENVSISGSGFVQRYARVAAGSTEGFTASITGESSVELSFLAGERSILEKDLGYIEPSGGYRVTITVNKDLQVHHRTTLVQLYDLI